MIKWAEIITRLMGESNSMGVDAVLIVENSRGISLEKFLFDIERDNWSKCTIDAASNSPDCPSWIEFEWEGIRYFSLASGTARYKFLMPRQHDFNSNTTYENPDFDREILISFLKIALAAERIAGGPVYLGNDAIHQIEPPEDIEEDGFFSIPFEIDSLIPEWRQIALEA